MKFTWVGSYEYYYCTIKHQISQTNSANHYINLSNKSALLLGIGSIQVTLALTQQHISPDSIIDCEANRHPSVITTHMLIIKNMAPYNKFYTETCMYAYIYHLVKFTIQVGDPCSLCLIVCFVGPMHQVAIKCV